MTDLDKTLATLAAITGRDPVGITYYHDHEGTSVDCAGLNCFSGECPFYDRKAVLRTSCTAPKDNSPDFDKAIVKTYELALTNYPELFL